MRLRVRDLDLLSLKESLITSDLLFIYDIYHDVLCVKLPCYIKHFSHDERRRLRLIIKHPQLCSGNESLTFHKVREARSDLLCLKCEIEPKCSAFKSSYFFRTVQEWNSLPSEIKESATKSIFRAKLLRHIKHEVFKTLEDIDDTYD